MRLEVKQFFTFKLFRTQCGFECEVWLFLSITVTGSTKMYHLVIKKMQYAATSNVKTPPFSEVLRWCFFCETEEIYLQSFQWYHADVGSHVLCRSRQMWGGIPPEALAFYHKSC